MFLHPVTLANLGGEFCLIETCETSLRALLGEKKAEATIGHTHLIELITINLLIEAANKSAFKLCHYSFQQ